MQISSQASFVRAVSISLPSLEAQNSLIAQGLCALSVPLSLVVVLIVHHKRLSLKRRQQIAMLERLWYQDSNDRV